MDGPGAILDRAGALDDTEPYRLDHSASEPAAAEGQQIGDDSEDMDEDSDSDLDIITERPDGADPKPPLPRHATLRNSTPQAATPPAVSQASSKPPQAPVNGQVSQLQSSSLLPDVPPPWPPSHSSNPLDVSQKPEFTPLSKPLIELDLDKDFPPEAKLWRKPGQDISDYFNYGFDEFSWSTYVKKQSDIRAEFNSEKIMEEMQAMTQQFMGSGAPGRPGGPNSISSSTPNVPGGAGPQPPGMDGMPPDMQAMMAQMMSSGTDISQMDFQQFAQMMGGPPLQPQHGGFGGVGNNFNQRDDGGGGNYGNYGRGRGNRRH